MDRLGSYLAGRNAARWVFAAQAVQVGHQVPADVLTTLDWTQRAGVVGLLLLIIVGGARKWWVFGHTFEAMEKDRDYYREIAMRLLQLTDRATKP